MWRTGKSRLSVKMWWGEGCHARPANRGTKYYLRSLVRSFLAISTLSCIQVVRGFISTMSTHKWPKKLTRAKGLCICASEAFECGRTCVICLNLER